MDICSNGLWLSDDSPDVSPDRILVYLLAVKASDQCVCVCFQESDYGFDDDGGGNDSDFVSGSSSRKSRKSRASQKHVPQAAPVQDSNSGRKVK